MGLAVTSARGKFELRVVPGGAARASAPLLPSDEQIVEAVARGEPHVASALYDRVVGAVDRTLVRVFGRREADHDDLVQAAFEQIVRTLSQRRFVGACSLSTWASRVAAHVGLNALRSRRRERRVIERGVEVDEPAGPANADRELQARSDVERVRAIFASMDPAKAEAVFLHDVLGYELAEVAVLTHASVAAAQSRLVRGRRELIERLEREGVAP